MKLTTLLPFAAITTAFVIPDELMTDQIVIESQKGSKSFFDRLPSKDDIFSGAEKTFEAAVAFSENALDNAINAVSDAGRSVQSSFACHDSTTAFDINGWLESAETTPPFPFDEEIFERPGKKPKGPHHKPPHHNPPHHGRPHHKHKSNLTVYELIAKSKYTTKLAKLIDEYPDVVELLNGTAANYTVFAPTDKAFAKLPKGHKKPSAEFIKAVLAYHVSPEFYPAGRLLVSHTVPSTLGLESLGGNPQRLRVNLGLRGLAVNFYSKIVAADIFGANGVIHGIDSLLLPPPSTLKIINLLPGEFSTLSLGLEKTGLFNDITSTSNEGGTFFAPSNLAFKKLGPKINAFLFSSYGEKYLKALLQYHIVANQTLYSDAFYGAKESTVMKDFDPESLPKGFFHVDLPTLLEEKSLSIDIARWGGFITIKINGFSSVAVQDGIAKDGAIHVLSSVLIPPKTPGGAAYMGEEMEVEELKERLGAYVEEDKVYEL